MTYLKKEKRLFVEHRTKLKSFCSKYIGDVIDKNNINFVLDEDGSVPNRILEKAFKFNVDLIVVGTKGASPIKEFLLGSTTKGLIRNSSYPVLAVPANSDLTSFKKMIYATDFEQADIFAINRLVKIAKIFDAEVRVVHVTTKIKYVGKAQMQWFKEMLQKKVAYGKLEFDLIFSDDIIKELVLYLKASEADMLAMFERKESNDNE